MTPEIKERSEPFDLQFGKLQGLVLHLALIMKERAWAWKNRFGRRSHHPSTRWRSNIRREADPGLFLMPSRHASRGEQYREQVIGPRFSMHSAELQSNPGYRFIDTFLRHRKGAMPRCAPQHHRPP
jgi:hypothetical protein